LSGSQHKAPGFAGGYLLMGIAEEDMRLEISQLSNEDFSILLNRAGYVFRRDLHLTSFVV